jgi:hypothetical protein
VAILNEGVLGFLSSFKLNAGKNLKLGNDRLLSVIIHCHPIIQLYRVGVTDSIAKYIINK